MMIKKKKKVKIQTNLCICGHWNHEEPAKGRCVNMGCPCQKYIKAKE